MTVFDDIHLILEDLPSEADPATVRLQLAAALPRTKIAAETIDAFVLQYATLMFAVDCGDPGVGAHRKLALALLAKARFLGTIELSEN